VVGRLGRLGVRAAFAAMAWVHQRRSRAQRQRLPSKIHGINSATAAFVQYVHGPGARSLGSQPPRSQRAAGSVGATGSQPPARTRRRAALECADLPPRPCTGSSGARRESGRLGNYLAQPSPPTTLSAPWARRRLYSSLRGRGGPSEQECAACSICGRRPTSPGN
jgi:hypothetical protein